MKQVLMVFALLALVFPAAAQRQSAVAETEIEIGGFTVSLTDGWSLAEDDFEPVYSVDESFEPVVLTGTDGLEAILVDGVVFGDDIAVDAAAEEALLAALFAVYEVEVEASELETAEVNGVDAVFWAYEDVDTLKDTVISGAVYWVTVDGAGLLIDVYAEESVFADSTEAVDALLVGVQLTDAEAVEAEAVACFVSTETARTATVRVGPGTNRTSLLFLPVGTDYPVTGQFVTDDGAVWYQLDKLAVDPNTSAAELWVAQADVDETADCALVGEASAPPIRPIIPSAPADGSTVQAGIIPQNGDWVMTFADRGIASCIGTESIDYEARQALNGQMSTPASPLTVAQGGESFNYDGFTFALVSPGNYFGSINIDRSVFMIRATVVNTGFMTGEAVIDVQTVFSRCSATIGITIARQ